MIKPKYPKSDRSARPPTSDDRRRKPSSPKPFDRKSSPVRRDSAPRDGVADRPRSAERPYKPAGKRFPERSDREARPYSDRPASPPRPSSSDDRNSRPAYKKPFDRTDRPRSSDRPYKPAARKPFDSERPPRREYKPREDSAERPRSSDRPYKPAARKPFDSERPPRREYRPREDSAERPRSSDRPYKPEAKKPFDSERPPRREYKPREDSADRPRSSDRPYKPAPKRYPERSVRDAKPYSDRPARPSSFDDRPRRPAGSKPYERKSPYPRRESTPRDGSAERPYRPAEKKFSERESVPETKRPYENRETPRERQEEIREFHEERPRRDDAERPPRPSKPGLCKLYGRKPILEALRMKLVRSLEISRHAHGRVIDDLRRMAEEQNIPITIAEALPTEDGLVTQGVRAEAFLPPIREDLRVFLKALPKDPPPLLLMLDSVTDPQNFGAILRSAEGAGVQAVIIREQRQAPINDVVVKASAGAAILLPIFQVVNLSRALKHVSEEGFWSVAAVGGEGSVPYTDQQWDIPLVLIVGAEGTGVSDLLRRDADIMVSIPMLGQLESLNVSVATGILLFEAVKARQVRK